MQAKPNTIRFSHRSDKPFCSPFHKACSEHHCSTSTVPQLFDYKALFIVLDLASTAISFLFLCLFVHFKTLARKTTFLFVLVCLIFHIFIGRPNLFTIIVVSVISCFSSAILPTL